MGENTTIEWATHSWSPWRGCTKVSPGCAHCYAEALSKRNPAVLGQWGKGKPRVLAKNWGEPVRWDKASLAAWDAERGKGLPASFPPRPTVFPSLCDWLDDEVHVAWLVRFLTLIHDTPNLTWLLLTKRPEDWHRRVILARNRLFHDADADAENAEKHHAINVWLEGWHSGFAPPSNVWVGTSVEDQTRADERIPKLFDIPAAGRFLSVEPLLGEVDITENYALTGQTRRKDKTLTPVGSGPRIDWVIVGGESGSGARPCNVKWIRSLVGQCKAADVPVFVKQVGAEPVFNAPRRVDDWGQEHISEGAWISAMTHPKGGDPAEWYYDLRVREFPVALGGAR